LQECAGLQTYTYLAAAFGGGNLFASTAHLTLPNYPGINAV